MASTALFTDHYELTMLDAALRDGTGQRPCAFEMFVRNLPEGRRYGVVAGTERWLDALARFRFGQEELDVLADHDVVSPETLRWLADYRFTGDVDGYLEGELYFPGSPVLTVHGTFAEAVLLESLTLSVFNHDSAIASAAARMVQAAGDRTLLEFGTRRAHEEAAVAAARAAVIVGFDGTSNLEAGRRYGVPTLGTSAHAFTLVHDDESAAFDAQVAALGRRTTLLVDTFDTQQGVARAIEAAGRELGAIRIDSGDLGDEARKAREQLDGAGLTGTKIVVSGNLDEYRIAALTDAPIDGYGVGTSVVTGSGAPAAGFVYKLVARATSLDGALEPVAKSGGQKATIGGCKAAHRHLDAGVAAAEVLRPDGADTTTEGRPLQVPLIRAGEPVVDASWQLAQEHHRSAIAELPAELRGASDGDPAIPTIVRPGTGQDRYITAPTEEVAR
jgi:nicotinate phosphoribosyltransferase